MPPRKRKVPTQPQSESSEESSAKHSKSDDTTSSQNDTLSMGLKLKIISWNINGIRAWVKKNGQDYLTKSKPDMLLLQETKCGTKNLPTEVKNMKDYNDYFQETINKSGYAGVGLLSKIKPQRIIFGMGNEEHDAEGRLLTADYDKFYLLGAYVPNSGQGLKRLSYRKTWDDDFLAYIKKLDKDKPVIYTGDLNVAHEEIDLANPKANRNKSAGFTDQERASFTKLLEAGFVDTFRMLHPNKKDAYTFWSMRTNARASNTGWRLDYFVVSQRIADKVVASDIDADVLGSDHCPIILTINL